MAVEWTGGLLNLCGVTPCREALRAFPELMCFSSAMAIGLLGKHLLESGAGQLSDVA